MIFEDVSVPRLQTNSQAWDGPSDGLFMVVEEIVTDAGKHVDPGTESGSTSLHDTAPNINHDGNNGAAIYTQYCYGL